MLRLFLFVVAVSFSAFTLAAARPITGVSCDGGFYIRTPDKHIHWVDIDNQQREQVYGGENELYAMMQCDHGVVSVWQRPTEGGFQAFYSPTCRSIGVEAGETRLLYEGKLAITRFERDDTALITTLADGSQWRGESCESMRSLGARVSAP